MKPVIYFLVTNDLVRDQRMHRICATLADAGYKIILVGRQLDASLEFKPEAYEAVRLKCRFNKGKLFYMEYNLRLFLYLLFKRMDAIGVVDNDTMPGPGLVSLIRRKKLTFDAHEFFIGVPELKGRRLSRWIWDMVLRCFLPLTDLRYTVNQSIAELHKKCYGAVFQVIRNFPVVKPDDAQNVEINWNSKILLYQGMLNEGRGIEQLIESMKELEDMKLFLAGYGDLESKLKEAVADQGLSDRVVFTGLMRPEELEALTKKAFAGFNLLIGDNPNYYYSLANKFFDYVRAGIPQISMNYPEYQRMNSEHKVAILLDAVDPDAIVKAIQMLQSDFDTYKAYHHACNDALSEWNWQREGERLVELYKEVLPLGEKN